MGVRDVLRRTVKAAGWIAIPFLSGCLADNQGIVSKSQSEAPLAQSQSPETGNPAPTPTPPSSVPTVNPSAYSGLSRLNVRVLLAGPYSAATGKMATTLNSTYGALPHTTPYRSDFSPTAVPVPTLPSNFFSLNTDLVDWVQIELRVGPDKKNTILRKSAFVDSSGELRDLDASIGVSVPVKSGDYYLVVRHRNHLAVMSAAPISVGSNSSLVDLTRSESAVMPCVNTVTVYGPSDCLKQVSPGVFALFSGDVNQDGMIIDNDSNSSDQNVIHDTVLGGRTGSSYALGYTPGDLNLDWYTLYDHDPSTNLPINDDDYLLSVTLAGQSGAKIVENPNVQ